MFAKEIIFIQADYRALFLQNKFINSTYILTQYEQKTNRKLAPHRS